MAKHPRIPAQTAHTVDSLTQQYGSEEGVVEAFLLHQLSDDDHHVLSPTWMTCCLLRRVLSKLEEIRAAVRGEPPFDETTPTDFDRWMVQEDAKEIARTKAEIAQIKAPRRRRRVTKTPKGRR